MNWPPAGEVTVSLDQPARVSVSTDSHDRSADIVGPVTAYALIRVRQGEDGVPRIYDGSWINVGPAGDHEWTQPTKTAAAWGTTSAALVDLPRIRAFLDPHTAAPWLRPEALVREAHPDEMGESRIFMLAAVRVSGDVDVYGNHVDAQRAELIAVADWGLAFSQEPWGPVFWSNRVDGRVNGKLMAGMANAADPTLGHRAAARLGVPVVALDDLVTVARANGRSITKQQAARAAAARGLD